MKKETVYFLARIITVLFKPLFILCLTQQDKIFADRVTLVFVVSSLTMLLIQFDPHRFFYKAYFSSTNDTNRGNQFSLTRYLSTIEILTLLGGILSIFLYAYKTSDLLGATAVGLFFLSEKIYDEILRLNLFSKHFDRWGYWNLYKTALFLICSLPIMILSSFRFEVFLYTYCLLSLLTFTIFFKYKPNYANPINRIFRKSKIAYNNMIKLRSYWFASLLSLILGNYDRLVVYIFAIPYISDFYIILAVISVIPLLLDFFYTSLNRRAILDGELNSLKFLSSGRLPLILLISFTLVIISFLCMSLLGVENYFLRSYTLIFVLIFSQTIAAISSILRDIVYWHLPKGRLVFAEFITAFLAIACLFSVRFFSDSLFLVFMTISIVLSIRIVLLGLLLKS